MTRGLVIGKFLPVHEGHIALIKFAAIHCDEVIVSMSDRDGDTIPVLIRLSWLQKIFEAEPKVKVHILVDDFDPEDQPLEIRTRKWAEVIGKKYPAIHIVFSSEEYGLLLAANLQAKHMAFDPARKKVPVSATLIRTHPFRYWDFIPPIVRPYFVSKICFYGPESTGKSVMAKKLAEAFGTEYVPEVARELITSNEFTVDDIIRIGYAQTERVVEKSMEANKLLLCDTDVITTQIYSRHYLGVVPEVLYDLEKKITYSRYFLFDIDVPWHADGMRDLGHAREEMFKVFRSELEKRKIPYTLVQGTYEERERFVYAQLNEIIVS